MIRPPSAVRDYDTHYSGDPALKQAPGKDLSDEHADYLAKIKAARETGDWTPLLIAGQTATKFVLGQVSRADWRAMSDRIELDVENPRRIGVNQSLSLLFRMSIKSIPGWGEKFGREPDPQWDGWVMAPAALVTQLDEIDPGIVSELGWVVLQRLRGVSPLS